MMSALEALRRRPLGRLATFVVAAAVLLALGFGADRAFAFFTSGGSGTGHASVATAQDVVISAGTATTPLQPGGTGDLAITATNPNSFSVQIVGLSISGSVTATGCTTPSVTLVSPQTSYLPVTIPANALATPIDISAALTMGLGASSDCQNKTLTVPLNATVHR
jgi:hypothetical protein